MNTKTTWRFRIKTNEYQSVIKGDRSNLFRYAKRGGNTGNLNWEKHHLPMLGIRLVAKRTLYSSSSLTWKRPRGNRQFSHLFIGSKGPRDDKTQNTHVLNSRASLGTSGNKMADKHRGLQLFATSGRKNVMSMREVFCPDPLAGFEKMAGFQIIYCLKRKCFHSNLERTGNLSSKVASCGYNLVVSKFSRRIPHSKTDINDIDLHA